jgi:hypothetical protein
MTPRPACVRACHWCFARRARDDAISAPQAWRLRPCLRSVAAAVDLPFVRRGAAPVGAQHCGDGGDSVVNHLSKPLRTRPPAQPKDMIGDAGRDPSRRHHRSPASASSRRGRIPDSQLPQDDDTTARFAAECQSFRDHLRCRVCARRIRNSPAGADNRLVAGSSPPSPTTQSRRTPLSVRRPSKLVSSVA